MGNPSAFDTSFCHRRGRAVMEVNLLPPLAAGDRSEIQESERTIVVVGVHRLVHRLVTVLPALALDQIARDVPLTLVLDHPPPSAAPDTASDPIDVRTHLGPPLWDDRVLRFARRRECPARVT